MIPPKIFTDVVKFKRVVFLNLFRTGYLFKRTREDSCPFPEKSFFCTVKAVTIEWLNLAQSLRSWSYRDSQSSSRTSSTAVIKSPIFQARGCWLPVRFFVKSPHHFGHFAYFATSVSKRSAMLSRQHLRCKFGMKRRRKVLHPPKCQRTPPTIPEGHASSLPVPHQLPRLFALAWVLLQVLPGPYDVCAYFVSSLARE